jgi:hypothetical protein
LAVSEHRRVAAFTFARRRAFTTRSAFARNFWPALALAGNAWSALAFAWRIRSTFAVAWRVWSALAFTWRVWSTFAVAWRVWSALAFTWRVWSAIAFAGRVWPAIAFAGRVWPAITFAWRVWPTLAVAWRALASHPFTLPNFRQDSTEFFHHRFGFGFQLFRFVGLASGSKIRGPFPTLTDFVFGAFEHLRGGAGNVPLLAGSACRFAQFVSERLGLFLKRPRFVVLARFFQFAGFLHQRFDLGLRFGGDIPARLVGADDAGLGQSEQQRGQAERPAATHQTR